MLPKDTFIPQLGGLYQFREDNKDFLLSKYGYYYRGLAMCIKTDILHDMKYYSGTSLNEEVYYLNNPIYCFELYSCVVIFNMTQVVPNNSIRAELPLYLTMREANDMMFQVGI